jgi:uncharacterized protein
LAKAQKDNMLRVYFSSLLLIVFVAVSCGQKKNNKEQTTTSIETGKDTLSSNRFNKLIPKPVGVVSDYVHLLTNEETDWLGKRIADLKAQTSTEMVVAILDIDTTQVNTYEAFDSLSLQLANQWGVGEKGKNNGVAFVIAPKLRMLRIHVGDGLLAKLTNAEAKKIVDEIIVPQFKKGKYFDAILEAVDTMIFKITYEPPSKSQ